MTHQADVIIDSGSLMHIWQERQRKIQATLPSYGRAVLTWAVVAFVGTSVIQVVVRVLSVIPLPTNPSSFRVSALNAILQLLWGKFWMMLDPGELSIGGIVSVILSLFSNIVMWAFVICSMTFIPHIAYRVYKASQSSPSSAATKPFRWLQLYASTILPITVFAIAWNSIPHGGASIGTAIESVDEAIYVVVGTFIVSFILYVINRLIPVHALPVRVALLSSTIYAAVFIAYGAGQSVASFSLLFGMLLYLMVGSKQIEEVGNRIMIYDLDTGPARKVISALARYQELQVAEEEQHLSQRESELIQRYAQAKNRIARARLEQMRNQQLSDLQEERFKLVHRMNNTEVRYLFQKLDWLTRMFDATQTELSKQLDLRMSKRLRALTQRSKMLKPPELHAQMRELIDFIDPKLDESGLDDLRTQLIEVTSRLESHIGADSNKPPTDLEIGRK